MLQLLFAPSLFCFSFHIEMIAFVKLKHLIWRITFHLKNISNDFLLLDCSTLRNTLFEAVCFLS